MTQGVDATETRWDASDLDRCEHGRHSIDDCFDCPGGRSSGNLFLLGLARGHHAELTARAIEGLARIGTTLAATPIYVRPNRRGME